MFTETMEIFWNRLLSISYVLIKDSSANANIKKFSLLHRSYTSGMWDLTTLVYIIFISTLLFGAWRLFMAPSFNADEQTLESTVNVNRKQIISLLAVKNIQKEREKNGHNHWQNPPPQIQTTCKNTQKKQKV